MQVREKPTAQRMGKWEKERPRKSKDSALESAGKLKRLSPETRPSSQ